MFFGQWFIKNFRNSGSGKNHPTPVLEKEKVVKANPEFHNHLSKWFHAWCTHNAENNRRKKRGEFN